MIKLKQIIKYDNANVLEATWTEVTEEAIKVPKKDEEGNAIEGEFVDEIQTKETQIKCHAYDGSQMDMLRADSAELGTPLDEYEALIAEVEANIVPPPPPTSEELAALV